MGLWLCQDSWLAATVRAIQSGTLKAAEAADAPMMDDTGSLTVTEDGIAVLSLIGPLMKGQSKFGGTSSVGARIQLRKALADDDVRAILLAIDSPGGHVAGTKDLADEIAAAQKPEFAQIDDLAASAALWIASQADQVFANATALVGSIGTYMVVYDSSEAFEREGVKVHVISTGDLKGAMVEGSKITKAQLAAEQELVNDINDFFVNAMADGRDLSREAIEDIADGRVWIAAKAQKLGLIDGIQTFPQTLETIRRQISGQRSNGRSRSLRARLAIRSAESAKI